MGAPGHGIRRIARMAAAVKAALTISRMISVVRFMLSPFPLSRRLLFLHERKETKRRERERRAKDRERGRDERVSRGRDNPEGLARPLQASPGRAAQAASP
jgi:hypothetical protein